MAMVDSTKFSPSTATQNRKFAFATKGRSRWGCSSLSTQRSGGQRYQLRTTGLTSNTDGSDRSERSET